MISKRVPFFKGLSMLLHEKVHGELTGHQWGVSDTVTVLCPCGKEWTI